MLCFCSLFQKVTLVIGKPIDFEHMLQQLRNKRNSQVMLLWICIFCRLVVKTSSGKTKASVGETKTNADKLSFIIIIITRYY